MTRTKCLVSSLLILIPVLLLSQQLQHATESLVVLARGRSLHVFSAFRFSQPFVSLPSNGEGNENAAEEIAAAIIDEIANDARDIAAITPIDMMNMASIRLAVDDMVIVVESQLQEQDFESRADIASQMRGLTTLLSNSAFSMTEVQTKVDTWTDMILAKSALVHLRSTVQEGTEAVSQGHSSHRASPGLPSNLVEFAYLMEKARTDIRALEDCVRAILMKLMTEDAKKGHDHYMSFSSKKMNVIDIRLMLTRIMSYVFGASELLDRLPSSVLELQEFVTMTAHSTQWRRLQSHKVIRRNREGKQSRASRSESSRTS